MNPSLPGVEESTVHKDVIFFNGHKFIGGAQAPGILIVKKFIVKNFNSNNVIPSSTVTNSNNNNNNSNFNVSFFIFKIKYVCQINLSN